MQLNFENFLKGYFYNFVLKIMSFKGVWLIILQFLNLVGIINQGFMTAFASEWSKHYYLENSTLNRFIYVVIFEVK